MNDIILRGVYDSIQINLFKSDDFIVSNIENLTWTQYDLATTDSPFLDGDKVQNIRGLARDITVELKPRKDKGDFTNILNPILKLAGQEVVLIWKNQICDGETADWKINGIIDSIDPPRFEKDVRLTFNIHCSNPYWHSAGVTAQSDANGYVQLKGTAPTKVNIYIPNGTIPSTNVEYPSGSTPPRLGISCGDTGWTFDRGNASTLTGSIMIVTTKDSPLLIETGYEPISVSVSGVKHLETVKTPLKAFKPYKLSCTYWHPDHENSEGLYSDLLPFEVYYEPRYY